MRKSLPKGLCWCHAITYQKFDLALNHYIVEHTETSKILKDCNYNVLYYRNKSYLKIIKFLKVKRHKTKIV